MPDYSGEVIADHIPTSRAPRVGGVKAGARVMDALSHALTAASCIVEMRVGSIYTRKGADVVGALSHQVDPSPYRNRNEDLFISVRVRVPSYALTPTLKDFTNKMSEDEREIAIAVLQTKRLELDEAIVRNQEAAADLDAQIEALKEVVL